MFAPEKSGKGRGDHPHEAWMKQIARNMTDAFDGPLLGARYLLHDRDSKYAASFDHIIASAGIEPTKLPARSPNLNAYAERWVLSVKSEALDHLILVGEKQVRRVLGEYLAHYHEERAHQGIGGQIIRPGTPLGADPEGHVACRTRLGGPLRYYHRPAA